jgi:hypothetical protein
MSPVETPPPDYKAPVLVYLVEEANTAGEIGQLGGFLNESEANELRQRLEAEGRAVRVNLVPIHHRIEDWEYDR